MLSALVTTLILSIPHICLARTSDGLANVTTAFSRAKIVPKVIKFFRPSETLNLSFTNSATTEDMTVNTGSLLTIGQTANEPHFTLGSGESLGAVHNPGNVINSSYVIVIFDPDAPTPQMPNASEALHFVGGNFTVDPSGTLSNSSAALVEYLPPSPPDGSDPHRYIALVYNQPHDFNITGPMLANSSTPRLNFSVSDFTRSARLRSPIAGNFFLVGSSSSSNSSSGSTPSSIVNTATASSTDTGSTTTQPTINNDLTSGLLSLTLPTPSTVTSPISVSAAISWKADAPVLALVSAFGAIILLTTHLL